MQQQQIEYMKWVNAQLRKKVNKPVINDLSSGMCDGVAFSDLIEIIAGEVIAGVVRGCELLMSKKLNNVQLILSFMKRKHIRMHEIQAQDVVAGDMKAIMRLVLALAVHFKPRAVKLADRQMSFIGCAQSAAVRLTEMREETERASLGHSANDRRQCTTRSKDSASKEFPALETRYSQLLNSYSTLSKAHSQLKAYTVDLHAVLLDTHNEMNGLKTHLLTLQQFLLSEGTELTGGNSEQDMVTSPNGNASISVNASPTYGNSFPTNGNVASTNGNIAVSAQRSMMDSHGSSGQILQDELCDLRESLSKSTANENSTNDAVERLKESLIGLRSHLTSLSHSQLSQQLDDIEHSIMSLLASKQSSNLVLRGGNVSDNDNSLTKVLVHSSHNATPQLFHLKKRLDSVRLSDVKTLLGNTVLRYFFKLDDPLYGIIKEEVCDDDAVVPHFEGSVVLWTENR